MQTTKRRLLRYWVTFDLLVLLLLFTLILLPLVVTSILAEVLDAPHGQRFPLWTVPHRTVPPTHTTIHLHAVALDELRQRVTLEVVGYDICPPSCDRNVRIRLFSLLDAPEEGLPPGASMTLPASAERVTREIQLPILGQPIRYPFDAYDLWLGVVLEQVLPDGTVQVVPPAEARAQLLLSIEERLPQLTMTRPVPIDPQQVPSQPSAMEYVQVVALSFERLVHVRVLAVVLVLLAAALASTVFVRPLQDLIVNIGAMVLGFWGMRSMLTPSEFRHVTAVDMALAIVILCLLLGITIRTLLIVLERRPLQRRRSVRRATHSKARAVHNKTVPVGTGSTQQRDVSHRVARVASTGRR